MQENFIKGLRVIIYSIDSNIFPGIRVREAIKDWSFQEQYDFGIKVLKDFGWDGLTGIIK